MTERLLQFIWQFQYFNKADLQTIEGEAVSVLFPGYLNKNQGPGFLDARIKIGHTILAESVEFHLKTTDWERHKHSDDANYTNVILHVEYINDVVYSTLPVLELSQRISKIIIGRYD